MLYTSLFKDLTKQTQVTIDKASELKKQLFDQTIFEKFLMWDSPSIGLSFEELIGSYNLSIAAATMDAKGNAPVMGTEGLQTLMEKVLLHKISYNLTAQEYRKILELLDSKSIGDKAKAQQLINLMFKNVKNAVDGVNSKLDIIFLGALSNEGVFTFNDTNNPEGGVKGTIDHKMPTANKLTVTTSWIDANIETVDCWEDLGQAMDIAAEGIRPAKMLMAWSKVNFMLRNKALKQVIFGSDKKSTPLMLTSLNEFLRQNEYPEIEIIRRKARIQNNGVITEITPWNADKIVFIPEGQIGVVKNAYADSELRPEAGIAYSNYGRIRVSQYGVGEAQGGNASETTTAQAFALPIITEINSIYSLNTIKP